MTEYYFFCKLTPEQKILAKKNPHTLHIFCTIDNIIYNNTNKIIQENGYSYQRNLSNKLLTKSSINQKLIEELYFQKKLKLKIDDNFPKLPYEPRRQNPTTTIHEGQLKLFIIHLKFLLQYAPKNKEIHIVYPGSASGINTHYITKFFPHCKWYLIDPTQHYHKLQKNKNIIHIKHEFFDNNMATYYKELLKDKFTLFICDIRFRGAELVTDDIYDNDAKQIYEWTKIFNANYSFLKFRPPRYKNFKYLDGEIFLQPYAPITSSETRLLVKKNAKDKVYDMTDYDDKIFYHNRILRVCNYKKVHQYNIKGLDYCFDCCMFVDTIKQYFNTYKTTFTKYEDIIYYILHKIYKTGNFNKHNQDIIDNIL